MKLTLQQLINIWNRVDQLYKINDIFPPMWDVRMSYNFKLLQPVIQQLQAKPEEELEEIIDQEIDLPLSAISVNDFPKNVFPGTTVTLRPLLMDYEEPEDEFNLDELLNKNGQTEDKNGQATAEGVDGQEVESGAGSDKVGD